MDNGEATSYFLSYKFEMRVFVNIDEKVACTTIPLGTCFIIDVKFYIVMAKDFATEIDSATHRAMWRSLQKGIRSFKDSKFIKLQAQS